MEELYFIGRFSNGVPSLFFISYSSLPSLLRGLKGERGSGSPFEFSLWFSSYRSTCQQPIGTRFLHAIMDKKKRTLWSGVPRSILPDTRPFLHLLLLGFLAQFLFSCYRPRYDLLPNDRVSVIHVDSPNNLFSFATFSRANHRHPFQDWIAIIVKWGYFSRRK